MINNAEDANAKANKAITDFGKPSLAKEEMIKKVTGLVLEEYGNNVVQTLDLFLMASFSFLINCAKEQVGFYPKHVVDLIESLKRGYEAHPDVAAFVEAKPIDSLPDGPPAS